MKLILLIITTFLGGTLCYYLLFSVNSHPDSSESADRSTQITNYYPDHYIEKEPRWFRRFGIEKSWNYGIVPAEDAHHQAEIFEVSRYNPDLPVTEQTSRAAAEFRSAVMTAAYNNGWDDVSKAMDDGYSNGPPFDFLHYVNFDNTRDADVLNPQKPEFLMFYPTSSGPVLAGAMFLTENLYDQGPQPGGTETVWHFHTSEQAFCFRNNVMVEFEDDNSCNGTVSRRSPEMLHVWFVGHPQGDYSTEMCLPAGIIEGWDGRKTWEEERARRFDQHIKLLRSKKFTLPDTYSQ